MAIVVVQARGQVELRILGVPCRRCRHSEEPAILGFWAAQCRNSGTTRPVRDPTARVWGGTSRTPSRPRRPDRWVPPQIQYGFGQFRRPTAIPAPRQNHPTDDADARPLTNPVITAVTGGATGFQNQTRGGPSVTNPGQWGAESGVPVGGHLGRNQAHPN